MDELNLQIHDGYMDELLSKYILISHGHSHTSSNLIGTNII